MLGTWVPQCMYTSEGKMEMLNTPAESGETLQDCMVRGGYRSKEVQGCRGI